MKIFSIFVFSVTVFCCVSSVCMDKEKWVQKSTRKAVEKWYKKPYEQSVAVNETMVVCLRQSNTLLKSMSKNKSYTLDALRNWFVPLSRVNKFVYTRSQNSKFIRAVISSTAYDNDHYNEGDIAQVLNTPGSREYMRLSCQLFNPALTVDEMKKLIDCGADLNYRKQSVRGGDTPLIYFIKSHDVSVVQKALELRARLDHYTTIDPLSLSIKIGDTKIFNALMRKIKYKSDLYYPLRYAIEGYAYASSSNGSVTLQRKYGSYIGQLLAKKANATEGLIYAIEQGYFFSDLIQLLLKHKAGPNEAFIKIVDYSLVDMNAPQEQIKNVTALLIQSPLFDRVQQNEQLLRREARINSFKAWIAPTDNNDIVRDGK